MDKTLQKLGDHIRTSEYKDLYPDTEVEKIKEDEEKLKEAVFQVHHIAWNKDLYQLVHDEDDDRYNIPMPEIRETCNTSEDFNRVQKMLRGATVTKDDDGNTLVPKTDLRDVLSAREGLMD